jgi:hypothetical protein
MELTKKAKLAVFSAEQYDRFFFDIAATKATEQFMNLSIWISLCPQKEYL